MKTANECLLDLERMVRDTGRVQTHVSYRTRIDCAWERGRINWYLDGRACDRFAVIDAIEASRLDPNHPANWRAANLPA